MGHRPGYSRVAPTLALTGSSIGTKFATSAGWSVTPATMTSWASSTAPSPFLANENATTLHLTYHV